MEVDALAERLSVWRVYAKSWVQKEPAGEEKEVGEAHRRPLASRSPRTKPKANRRQDRVSRNSLWLLLLQTSKT
jgi:hypothetical protein